MPDSSDALDLTRTAAPGPEPPTTADRGGGPTVPADRPGADAEPDPPFGPPAEPGDLGRLAHYRVLKRLGRGGMGAVYLAIDEHLHRRVALKVMRPLYAANPAARDRFLREARTAAAVKHDHVVTIYQVGEDNGVPYIAMEFLAGYPLDEYLRRKGRLTVPQALRVGREAAAGLGAAHAIGLVHRDVKPANVWLEAPNGRVKILDFGLAKAVEGGESPLASQLTGTGVIVGTPQYMAPEQARGEGVDHRADLFGLGAVLYQLVTGRRPFEGPTVMAILTALAVEDPPPVQTLNPDVPPALADLIHRLLAKDPDRRPASADEVAKALRAIERGEAPAGDFAAAPSGTGSTPVVYVPIPVTAAEPNAFAGLTDAPAGVAESVARPAPRPGGRGVGLWVAAAAAVLVAGVTVYVGVRQFRGRPAPPEPTGRAEPKVAPKPPGPRVPPRPADPNRALAEWVLQLGGTVRIDAGDVTDPAKLPARPFRLHAVFLPAGGVLIRDADLERFRYADELDSLDVQQTELTDRGVELLASFPVAERLTRLLLGCPGVTDAGLAHLAKFRNLSELKLGGIRPSAAGLSPLAGLPGLRRLTLSGATIAGPALGGLRGANLTNLTLAGATIADDGLAPLKDLPTLTALDLGSAKFTDAGLKPLRDVPALQSLHLDHTGATDAGLAHVAGLKELKALYLRGTRVTDAGLAHLAGLTGLEVLDLYNMPVTDAGLKHLAGLRGLKNLSLTGARVSDAGAVHLAGLKQLESVTLSGTKVGDEAVARLVALPRVTTLDLDRTAVTDAGLGHLTRAKRPTYALRVRGTKVTAEAVRAFKLAVPGGRISTDFGEFGPGVIPPSPAADRKGGE